MSKEIVSEKKNNTPVETPVTQKPKKRKRRLGDRHDGYRVRNLDLPFYIIPNIMRSRLDSQIFFNIPIDIENLEKYVHKKRSEDIPNLRIIHVAMAAALRMFATRPQLNRFVAGKKIYAHNNISFSMTVKRALTDEGSETEICPVFEPTDTIFEVVEKFNSEVEKAFAEEESDTDKINRLVGMTPTCIKTFIVFVLRNLDKIGLMPKFITKASPFHASAYITDIGSLGIDSVYHHLYEFGTVSCFMAMGKKQYLPCIKSDGTLGQKKIINFRFVLDERITDGHYYAASIRQFTRFMKHPELLEIPPENIPEDL